MDIRWSADARMRAQTLQARIEEMHDENSLVYEKLAKAKALLQAWDRRREYRSLYDDKVGAESLLQEAMDIVHGYTNPNLTPPKEGN